MTSQTEINWKAVDRVAARLGAHTRALVAAGDTEEAIDWALKMGREAARSSEPNWPCAASYFELVALLEPDRLYHDEEGLEDEEAAELAEVDDDD